jgi:hypothetical protein
VLRSKWGRRYAVRLALVKNPHLALRFGVNLLPTLNLGDLREVRADESLQPMLRLAAQRLLELA